jgi:hypothetical protein
LSLELVSAEWVLIDLLHVLHDLGELSDRVIRDLLLDRVLGRLKLLLLNRLLLLLNGDLLRLLRVRDGNVAHHV